VRRWRLRAHRFLQEGVFSKDFDPVFSAIHRGGNGGHVLYPSVATALLHAFYMLPTYFSLPSLSWQHAMTSIMSWCTNHSVKEKDPLDSNVLFSPCYTCRAIRFSRLGSHFPPSSGERICFANFHGTGLRGDVRPKVLAKPWRRTRLELTLSRRGSTHGHRRNS